MSDIITELRERSLLAEQEGEPLALLDEAADEIARLRDALDEQTGRAAWNYDCLTQCEERVIQRDAEIARLRLTDAERAAVEWAVEHLINSGWGTAVLRGLLARTGDCPAADNAAGGRQ